MANHFCALVLYVCVCDMDHESAIKIINIIVKGRFITALGQATELVVTEIWSFC